MDDRQTQSASNAGPRQAGDKNEGRPMSDARMHVFFEPTLDDLLGDPLIAKVMASDGVSREALRALVTRQAGLLRRRRPQG
jgi:hypothetical protein